MKKSFRFALLMAVLLFLLPLISHLASACAIPGDRKLKLKGFDDTAKELEDDISNLVGSEEICGSEVEECKSEHQNRLLAEAHLDYIYTQKHPKP